MALVVKRQVNVRKDCLRKQTNYSRSRAVLYREQRSNAQFVSAIMLGSLLTAVSLLLPQSSFSFTLLQLSLANFVPKPWRTRKLHWEYDIVNLNHTVPSNFTNFRLPKSKEPKTQSLIVSSGQQSVCWPRWLLCIRWPLLLCYPLCWRPLSKSINASFAFLQHLLQKKLLSSQFLFTSPENASS